MDEVQRKKHPLCKDISYLKKTFIYLNKGTRVKVNEKFK